MTNTSQNAVGMPQEPTEANGEAKNGPFTAPDIENVRKQMRGSYDEYFRLVGAGIEQLPALPPPAVNTNSPVPVSPQQPGDEAPKPDRRPLARPLSVEELPPRP